MFCKFQLQILIYVKCKRSTGSIFLLPFCRQCKQKHSWTADFMAPMDGEGNAQTVRENLPQPSGQQHRLGALGTDKFLCVYINIHIYI